MAEHNTLLDVVKMLAQNFGKRLSAEEIEEKMSLYYRFFKGYSDVEIRSAADALINEGRVTRFPEIHELKKYIRPDESRKSSNIQYCERCERTGYYTVWQRHGSMPAKNDKGHWYRHAYACACNNSATFPRIDDRAIPQRAHNPYPPDDNRHEVYNEHTE